MVGLAKYGVMIAAYLVATGTASAEGVPQVNMFKPFVLVKTTDGALNLGDTHGPGVRRLDGRVVAHVVANCPYHLRASFSGLQHRNGKVNIAPKDMSVTINGRDVEADSKIPVSIVTSGRPTPRNGTDVPIDMEVEIKRLAYYPPGQYAGTLVVTVMAGP